MPIFWSSAADFCRPSRRIFVLSTTLAKPSTRSILKKILRRMNFFISFEIENLKILRTVV
jgi:hypothetical protein